MLSFSKMIVIPVSKRSPWEWLRESGRLLDTRLFEAAYVRRGRPEAGWLMEWLTRSADGPAYAALAFLLLVVQAPRVYHGVHYPADVLAGMALGYGCSWLALRILGG